MVRQPALEVMSYLKKTDISKPPTRYVLCILLNLCTHSHTHTQACHFLMSLDLPVGHLNKLYRWVERQWEDNDSLSHCPLLPHAGMAGVTYS